MARLGRKFETARTLAPKPVVEDVENAEIGLIAYGTTHHPVVEARPWCHSRTSAEGRASFAARAKPAPAPRVPKGPGSSHERGRRGRTT